MAELRTVFAAERGAQLIGRWVAKRFENTKGTDGETGEPKGQLFVAKITGFDPKTNQFTVTYPYDGAKEEWGDEDVDDGLLPLGVTGYDPKEDSDVEEKTPSRKRKASSSAPKKRPTKRQTPASRSRPEAAEAEDDEMPSAGGNGNKDSSDDDDDGDDGDSDDGDAAAGGAASAGAKKGGKRASKSGGGAARKRPASGSGKGAKKPSARGASAGKGKAKAVSAKVPDEYFDPATSEAEELSYTNKDKKLWGPCTPEKPPNPLPKTLRVLELFAGCGGFHMEGEAELGPLSTGITTVAAVELEEAPAETYAHNYHGVKVHNMGIARFLATSRRLHALKASAGGSASAGGLKAELHVDYDLARWPRLPLAVAAKRSEAAAAAAEGADGKKKNGKKNSTTDKQFKDHTLLPEIVGKSPLPWVRWRVWAPSAAADDYEVVRDEDLTPQQTAAVRAYLNDARRFNGKVFPLPGDVEAITGGPPCQGFSGYNATRPTTNILTDIFCHPENQLIMRFFEAIFWFRPLYVVMEEVPAVARPIITNMMQEWLVGKGYSMEFRPRIRTGLFGCPQTRDRLVVYFTREGMPAPAFPEPITRDPQQEPDSREVAFAFKRSKAAYPLTMRYLTDGTWTPEKAVLQRREWATGATASTSAAPSAAPSTSSKGKGGAKGGAKAPDADPSLAEAARAIIKSDRLSDAERALPRGLVLGDTLSCDLPIDGVGVGGKTRAATIRDKTVKYECAPPTPYLAYLRKDMRKGQEVSNHFFHKMGVLDVIRTQHVPLKESACWREMFGERGVISSPMGVWLSEEEWLQYPPTYLAKIPSILKANPKEKYPKGEVPKLKPKFEIRRRLMPLVPFWCLTKGHTTDHACYGRLAYADPSDTVHSYYKPHWHRIMPPFASRPTTVRDKARMQGFPDHFVFLGNVPQQYKQVANAVSPQLAKAIGRSLLTALTKAHVAAEKKSGPAPDLAQLRFKGGLVNFAEFLATFDETTLAKVNRFEPREEAPRRELVPLTYGEILNEYNTNVRYISQYMRKDHSSRFKDLTPFETLQRAQDNRNWITDKYIGIRIKSDVMLREEPLEPGRLSLSHFEVCALYPGFDNPEWSDLTSEVAQTLQYGEFRLAAWGEVNRVLGGAQRAFVLPGYGVDPEGEAYVHLEAEQGKALMEELEERYAEDFPEIVARCEKEKEKKEAKEAKEKEKKAAAKARAKRSGGEAAGEDGEEDGEDGGEAGADDSEGEEGGEEVEDEDEEEQEEEEEEEEGGEE